MKSIDGIAVDCTLPCERSITFLSQSRGFIIGFGRHKNTFRQLIKFSINDLVYGCLKLEKKRLHYRWPESYICSNFLNDRSRRLITAVVFFFLSFIFFISIVNNSKTCIELHVISKT